MRPLDLDDDFDEFEFADSTAVSRLMREQLREERRFASRRHFGPRDEDDYADIDDVDDDEFSDYGEDEFDDYPGIVLDR
jgi:hypothetical protein